MARSTHSHGSMADSHQLLAFVLENVKFFVIINHPKKRIQLDP